MLLARGLTFSTYIFVRSGRAKLLSYKLENCREKSEVASSSISLPEEPENSKLSRKYIFDVAAGHVWIRALKI